MSSSDDHVVRAMTNDGAFRVITARTTETVRGAVAAQRATGKVAECFGDLLTGVVLFRETMAPQLRVQAILKPADRSGTLVADSHPTGNTRGLVSLPPSRATITLDDGSAILQLVRTLQDGRLHQGIVEVPRAGGISRALMGYMQVSEQVFTVTAVGTVFEGEEVVSAGGYLVQLLPEVGRGPLMVMTERLEGLESIHSFLRDPGYSPGALLDELLHAMPFTRLDESTVRFACWCSKLRVLSTLATLPRSDIQELVQEGEPVEVKCHYCNREYQVAPAELVGLLQES